MKRPIFLFFVAFVCFFPVFAAAEDRTSPGVERKIIYRQNSDGYKNIRIPSICATDRGTLLAFAEGRTAGDSGKIELILRRSEDGGANWGPIQVVWKDGENTCGNPTPVFDRDTGTIWLLATWNDGRDLERQIIDGTSRKPRMPYVMKSEDDGKTWTEAKPLPHLRKENWRWYATGPCNGIQLSRGPYHGRLVIPANHSVAPEDSDAELPVSRLYRSHIVYSDDHGNTWKIGGVHEPYTNESTVLELEDGKVMQNMRSYHNRGLRAVSISLDGGLTFPASGLELGKPGDDSYLDPALQTPICQSNIVRFSWSEENRPGLVLFSSPYGEKRAQLSVWISSDEGKTWSRRMLLFNGPGAYSNLVPLPNGRVGLLAEVGENGPYETISFFTFSVAE